MAADGDIHLIDDPGDHTADACSQAVSFVVLKMDPGGMRPCYGAGSEMRMGLSQCTARARHDSCQGQRNYEAATVSVSMTSACGLIEWPIAPKARKVTQFQCALMAPNRSAWPQATMNRH